MVFSPIIVVVVVNWIAKIQMIKWSTVELTSRLIHCQTSHTHYSLFKQVCYSLRQAQKRKWPLSAIRAYARNLSNSQCDISVLFSISAYVHPTEVRMWRMLSLKPQRRSTRTFKTAAWTWTRPSQGSSTSLPPPRVGGSAVTHSLRRRAAAVNDHGDFTLSVSLFLPLPDPTSDSLCI